MLALVLLLLAPACATPDPLSQCDLSGNVHVPIAMQAANEDTILLFADGTVACWGGNVYGECAIAPSPARVPLAVSVPSLSCMVGVAVDASIGGGIDSDGDVLVWGTENGDEFADGEVASSIAPGVPRSIGSIPPMRAVSLKGGIVVSVDMDGVAWWWGKAKWNGEWVRQSTPVPVPEMPKVQKGISLGRALCGIRESGDVWCWGEIRDDLLGPGVPTFLSKPAQIQGLPPLETLSVDAYSSCGLAKDGWVYCAGSNSVGTIGNGMLDEAAHPPTRVEALGGGVREVAVNGSTACAVTSGDELFCWGANSDQIVSQSEGVVASPLLVGGGIRTFALGFSHLCILRTDDTVWCRGNPIAVGWDLTGATTTREFRQVILP